jgi:ABC-type transport system substrate-binding protein
VNSWRGTAGRIARGAAFLCAAFAVGAVQAQPKVLKYAFEIAETSFDPQRISDVYSNIVNQAMFEPPLTYDYLARPAKLKPNVVTSMPEISADGTTYTFHVRPGIHFADDPAFNGRKRELVAADFVYAIKRVLDPKVRASLIAEIEPYVVGAGEAAEKARKANKFDYDAPIEGLKAVDKYTFQVKIKKPMYVFIYKFADCRIACAVAREVAEKYGDDFGAHPVGTGPFRLALWKRSSKMVFERNPGYHEDRWDVEVPAGDPRAAEFEALRGRRLPMIDRVEVSVIEETQPRWLSFLNEEMDLIFLVPEEFAYQAFPNNKVAKNLERRGIRMEQFPTLDVTYAFYNMEDPVFGGYTPDKIALRRAINLSYKIKDEIAILRKGQAIPAQGPYAPGVAGYDPDFHTAANEYSPAKAKALLDMFGYLDRDGDGYREMPDGSQLTLHRYSAPSSRDQQFDELWKRGLDDIGIRVEMVKEKWPDTLKKARQGKVQFWTLGDSASEPDADTWLSLLYGPNDEQNLGRFKLRRYDELYEQARVMPDTPARTKLYQEMTKIIVAYAPWRINSNRIRTDMWYPQLVGYRRHPILTYNAWKYVDIDKARAGREITASQGQ